MNTYLKILIATIAGGLLGFGYYYFIGCNNGTCALTSNWYITTLYGAAMGLFLGIPSRKSKHKTREKDSDIESD